MPFLPEAGELDGGGVIFLELTRSDPFSQRPRWGAGGGGGGGGGCGEQLVGGRCSLRGRLTGELRRKDAVDTSKSYLKGSHLVLSTKQTSFYFLQASGIWWTVPWGFWRVEGPVVAPWAGRAAPCLKPDWSQTPRRAAQQTAVAVGAPCVFTASLCLSPCGRSTSF